MASIIKINTTYEGRALMLLVLREDGREWYLYSMSPDPEWNIEDLRDVEKSHDWYYDE